MDLRTLTHTDLTSFGGVDLRHVVDVTSDSDLAAFVEPTGLMEFQEAVVVVKGVNQVSTIFGWS